ncbi:hypothetical protein [Actinoplanes couchii]|uniref:Uncharacterized protein n=1 Tax=Actinoplanes couchii TaxID=403638 RepID=A0ABQ3XCX2_9ACTN|nr:hypothetical protein [Actinoplanes couchii]MDR6321237.1 hypothetical protein [Actinoplanes couchii]GID56346.1 hypothetical protein Aco03nite_047500 [Actinoplanes couchii]
MDRILFTERLRHAAEAARHLAAPSLVEKLPPALTLLVRLNMSYGDQHYPDDAGRVVRLSADEAADLLWRDGRAPEWVDVAVTGETGAATIIELTCCGRYVVPARDPFHVVGPIRPPADRRPFSIHHDFEVRDEESLRRLTEVADRVRRLFVDTPLPVPMPAGVWLVRDGFCPHGSLAAYAGLPELRILQITVTRGFVLAGAPLPALTSLTITGLPPVPWGMGALRALAPALTQVSLRAAGPLWAEGQLPAAVRDVQLAGTHLEGAVELPAELDVLGLHFSAGLSSLALLDGVEQVKLLSLRETPVAEGQVAALINRLAPSRVDLTHSGLEPAALDRLESGHPGVEVLPRRAPLPPSEYDGLTLRLGLS